VNTYPRSSYFFLHDCLHGLLHKQFLNYSVFILFFIFFIIFSFLGCALDSAGISSAFERSLIYRIVRGYRALMLCSWEVKSLKSGVVCCRFILNVHVGGR